MESEPRTQPPAIYVHPLAYLLGLEGVALLHAFAGDYDREFTMARLAEVRALLDAVEELGGGVMVDPIPTTEGYGSWAEFYDEPGNQLVDLEQPIVREILDGLPRGVALDAACGTGRHSAYLASLGHTVIGVDSPAAMPERPRQKLAGGRSRWSTTAASRSTGPPIQGTFPASHRTSGRSITGVPPRPTPLIAARPWRSSGSFSSAPLERAGHRLRGVVELTPIVVAVEVP